MAKWTNKPEATQQELDDDDVLLLAAMQDTPGQRDRVVKLLTLLNFLNAHNVMWGGIGGDVEDQVDLIGMFGRVQVGDTASRPAAPPGGAGVFYFDTDEGKTIVFNGSAWVNLDGTSL